MYRVLLERAAEKDLRKLPAKLHNRIIVALQTLAKNPRPAGCRKLTAADNDWRIRVGEYRIVYEIDDANQIVRVIASDIVAKSIVNNPFTIYDSRFTAFSGLLSFVRCAD